MDLPSNKRKSALAALLFASNKPLTLKEISSCLEPSSNDDEIWLFHLNEIEKDIETMGWGIELRYHAEGYQLVSQSEYFHWIKSLSNTTKTEKLSIAACEVLALLAIQTTMTRSQIEDSRGVDSAAVIQSLLDKGMIENKGKSNTPSGPTLYGLSQAFYQHFNVKDRLHLKKLYENTKSNQAIKESDTAQTSKI